MTCIMGANKKVLNTKSLEELKEKTNINSNEEIFSYLLNQILSNFKDDTRKLSSIKPTVERILGYLNYVVSESHSLDNVLIINKIMAIKDLLIRKIKSTSKSDRNNNDVSFLRSTINNLEDIEVVLQYNLPGDFLKTNSSIIKHILLKEKNLVLSESLIMNHPYLINICEDTDGHILDIIVNNYLTGLNEYIEKPNNKKNLQYYNELLRIILHDSKVKINEHVLERNKNRIGLIVLKSHAIGKEQLWTNHLYNMLVDPKNYNPSGDALNRLYDISSSFSKMVIEECKEHLKTPVSGRLNNTYIVTIDDSDVIARDDAVSMRKLNNGNRLLEVHIADVPKFVVSGSYLRRNAYKNSQTIYLGDQTIQMLPTNLLKGRISLDENQLRYVRTYCFEIDDSNSIIDFKIVKHIIKVAKNYDFAEANDILEHGSNIRETDELFEKLSIVPSILKKSLGFENSIHPSTKSEILVESLMMSSSYKTAEYFKNHGYPMLYRSHDMQKGTSTYLETKLDEAGLSSGSYSNCIRKIMDTCLSSYYSVNPDPHEGLRLNQYTGITSPARRYGDIVNCDCEDLFYFGDYIDEGFIEGYREELDRLANYLNRRNDEIKTYCEAYYRTRTKK